MLRSQLRDKAELLEASASDQQLRSGMEQLRDQLELRTQEVEDVKTLLRRTEAAKAALEAKTGELEQFRAELVKESNQHAQESGEKMRELRTQLDNEREELTTVVAERTALKSELDAALKTLQSTEARYKSLTEQGAPETGQLIADRDSLKDKNDKLKEMCKKYLAKLKQQEAALIKAADTAPPPPPLENPEAERYKETIASLNAELAGLRTEVTEAQASLDRRDEDLATNADLLSAKAADCQELEARLAERERTVAERDDLIRDLKAKLEAAPEDIRVSLPGPEADDEAHQKTKKELAVIKEKCKKLIVKVYYHSL